MTEPDPPPDELAERLVAQGYTRSDVVEHRGEFAVRGGIVDVFPGTGRRPARAEFDGDQIESLRSFTPATQLSTDKAEAIAVHPVRELASTPEIRKRAAALAPKYVGRIADGLARLADGLEFEGMESFVTLVSPESELRTPAGFFAEGSWAVLTQARRSVDRAEQALAEATALAEASEHARLKPIVKIVPSVAPIQGLQPAAKKMPMSADPPYVPR